MDQAMIASYEAMAKLKLNDDTRSWVHKNMNYLEAHFQKLEQIDTKDVKPLITVLELQNVLRDDVSRKFITRDELLANAPEEHEGYFQVPKTL